MQNSIRFFLMVLFVQCALPGFSKNLKLRQISVSEGLSNYTVTTIMQDSRGFIWIGTLNGLNRYDGNQIINYNEGPGLNSSLRNDRILSLCEGSDGKIWIGTGFGGVEVFNTKTEQFEKIIIDKENVLDDVVNSIYKLQNGDIICGTRAGNLFRCKLDDIKKMENGFIPHFKKLALLSNQKNFEIDRIIRIAQFGNNVWLIDSKNRLYKINYSNQDSEEFFVYQIHDNGCKVRDFEDNGGNALFLATSRGIMVIDRDSETSLEVSNIHVIPGTQSWNLNGIAIDKHSGIWVTTNEKDIYYVDNYLDSKPNISDYSSNYLNTNKAEFIDHSNVLWFSSFNDGASFCELSFKNFDRIKLYNRGFDLSNSANIRASLYDSKGNFWVGSYPNGLFINSSTLGLTSANIQRSSQIILANSIIEDHLGFVWVASQTGVFCLAPAFLKNASISDLKKLDFTKWDCTSFTNILYSSVTEDLYGNIWLSTDRDLIYLTRNAKGNITGMNILKLEENDKLSGCDIQIVKTNPGKAQLWVLQRGCGISVLNYDKELSNINMHHYMAENQGDNHISCNTINSIYFDSGNIWLCTDNGLNNLIFDNKKSKYIFKRHFDMQDGLPNNSLLAIEKDNQGNLWIGTNKGLSEYNQILKKFHNFTIDDGLKSSSFTNSSLKMQDGTLVFGTVKGLISFIPENIVLNQIAPKLAFTSLKILNNQVSPSEEYNGSIILKNSITQTRKITLNYRLNDITIGFSALHYAMPENNKYAYFLRGYHADWIYTDQKMPFTMFTKLMPGNYTLFLKASNSDDFWTEEPIALDIKILPPPWMTIWAYLLYLIITLVIIFITLRYWTKRKKLKDEIALEKHKKEQEKKINDIKLELFTEISHEFCTPLTLIAAPVRELIEKFKNDKDLTPIIVPLNLNLNRLLRLINQLLDFNKADTGNLKLQIEQVNVIELLNIVKNSYSEIASKKNIWLTFESPFQRYMTWLDADKIETITHNLISNALKNTPENGAVALFFDVDQESPEKIFIISVKDNGYGIPNQKLTKIFDRFYHDGKDSGKGIGLALVKKLVEIHKGRIEVHSAEKKGSDFRVFIPDGLNYYKNELSIQDTLRSDNQIPEEAFSQIEHEYFDSTYSQDEELPLILVVEDNHEIQDYIAHLLSQDYRILSALNGKLGLEKIRNYLPDLVISDILMPEMDGIDMCIQLKKDKNTSYIPILFLTSKIEEKDKIEGLHVGAIDYFFKPFNPIELKSKVKNIIDILKVNRERLRLDFALNPTLFKVESQEESFIQEAVKIVEENLNDGRFNLLGLCTQLGISRMQLHRKLKMVTGQSTTEFIRTIRLKRAAQLLETSHLTVLEVMYEVGIESSSYFSKAFKKQYKITPSMYADYKKENALN